MAIVWDGLSHSDMLLEDQDARPVHGFSLLTLWTQTAAVRSACAQLLYMTKSTMTHAVELIWQSSLAAGHPEGRDAANTVPATAELDCEIEDKGISGDADQAGDTVLAPWRSMRLPISYQRTRTAPSPKLWETDANAVPAMKHMVRRPRGNTAPARVERAAFAYDPWARMRTASRQQPAKLLAAMLFPSRRGLVEIQVADKLDQQLAEECRARRLQQGVEEAQAQQATGMPDELHADPRTHHAEAVAPQAEERRIVGHPSCVTVHISHPVDEAPHAKDSATVSICPVVTDHPSYVFLEDYKHRPYFVASNCLLQIGFFLYFSGTRGNSIALDAMGGPSLMHYRLVGDFPQCEDLRYQVWRLLSYQLVHKGYVHLLSNCVSLAILGLPVEMMVGTKPMLVVYNVGVAAGALTLGFTDAYRSVVGSSGGVYTLVGMHLANIVLNWHVMGYKRYAYVALLSVATLFDTARVLIQRDISTSYAAHFGGWIWGVLSGLFMLRHSLGGRLQLHEMCLTWGGGMLAILFINFAAGWVSLHQEPTNWITYGPKHKPCCWLEVPVPNTTHANYTCTSACVSPDGSCVWELLLRAP